MKAKVTRVTKFHLLPTQFSGTPHFTERVLFTIPRSNRQIPALAVLRISYPQVPVLLCQFVISNRPFRIGPSALWCGAERTTLTAHDAGTPDGKCAFLRHVQSTVLVFLPLAAGRFRLACRLGWCRTGCHDTTALLNHLFKVIPTDAVLATEQFSRTVFARPVAVRDDVFKRDIPALHNVGNQ